jgi:hypothetical protein
LSYTKDAAYAFCDALSYRKIPFELSTYSSLPVKGLEIIHRIDEGPDFSAAERNRFAVTTSSGLQSDVWAMESSAERVIPFAKAHQCTPFFILIGDGCTGVELKHAVKKLRRDGAVVVGVGIKLSPMEKAEFLSNFGTFGILVDDMRQLVNRLTAKLKVEKNRILLFS